MGAQTAPGTATWALGTATWALQTDLRSQELSKRPPGSILEQFWTPRDQKNAQKVLYCLHFSWFSRFRKGGQKRAPKRSKKMPQGCQNVPQERPGRPQQRPRRPQDGPGSRQERPKSAPRGSKSRPNSASEPSWRPTGAHVAPKSPPEGHFGPPAGRFSTLRGTIFARFSTLLGALSKLPCPQSLCKPTASAARRVCVTSTCGLVRRRTAGQEVLIFRRSFR